MQRRRQGKMRGPRTSRPSRPKSYKIICASCGKEVVVQIPPLEGKNLLCMDCFKK